MIDEFPNWNSLHFLKFLFTFHVFFLCEDPIYSFTIFSRPILTKNIPKLVSNIDSLIHYDRGTNVS